MLVYADLDIVEEIIKPNYLVMRLAKKKKIVSLSVPQNLNASYKGSAPCNLVTPLELHQKEKVRSCQFIHEKAWVLCTAITNCFVLGNPEVIKRLLESWFVSN